MIHLIGTIIGMMLLIFGTLFIIAVGVSLFTRRSNNQDWYW